MKTVKSIVQLIALSFFFLQSLAFAQPTMTGMVGISSYDDSDFGSAGTLRLAVGYQLSEAITVEAAVTDLGDFSGNGDEEIELSTFEFVVIGRIPLADSHELFVRVGTHHWSADVEAPNDLFSEDETSNDLLAGFGYAYVVDDFGAVKLELSSYEVDGSSILTGGIALEKRF